MGACIEAASTAVGRGGLRPWGARHLSDVAAHRALARAHHRPEELDLLVNVGLYKDRGVAEPALASIIQSDLGATPGHPPRIGRHGTFSFDLLDGGCGLVTAARLVTSLLAGPARRAMIVAADADPWPRTSRGFPFAPTGGAVVLARDDATPGFERFASRTFPEYADLFEVDLRWDPGGALHRGRNVIEVREAPEYGTRCVECATLVVRELLDAAALRPEDLDVVVASQTPRGFGPQVARAVGIPEDRVPAVDAGLARAHTAGPIASLEAAIAAGRLPHARHALFVTAGAGITIATALYRGAGA